MEKKSRQAFPPGTGRSYLCLLFILFISLHSFAQTITGTVSDVSGKGLANISVTVKGLTIGTSTNIAGQYSINAGPKATLVFSSVGFVTQEVAVSSRSSINIVLVTANKEIENVIVIALGIKRQTRKLGYAATSVKTEELVTNRTTNVGEAAKTYYENAIIADIATYALYPGTSTVPGSIVTSYINSAGVLYNPTDALKLINTQYWIVNLRNGTEAFANFRRSGYPALSPNLFNNKLNGGFVRRLSYPDVEGSSNTMNYQAAVAAIGGDQLITRVFWDTP